MNGKELVLAAIQRKPVDRIPWVPFVGCHGGALLKMTASAYLQSEDNLVKGIDESVRRYKPDGIPVAFDLQIEAEVLGCSVVWADATPPAVSSHPLATGKSLADLRVPGPNDGRIKTVLAASRRIRKNHPDLALYGLITGPFTLAMHLLGTDIFMKMYEDPETLAGLMAFCQKVGEAMAGYYVDAGCDIIAVVDPMTSQIGPDQFRQFVTPYCLPLFESIRKKKAFSSFFVCGQAQQNIEAMCETRPDNVSIDENIPLDYVRDICLARGISFGGNLQLTVVLLLGTENDVKRHALECMDIGKTTGFILAPGCDLPFATPPANLEAVAQIVHDPYQRDIARTLVKSGDTADTLDMSEYGQADKVIVDIITLDSESCAPCQYMVEAVRNVCPEFEGIVEWREHKIKYRESLVFMASLMVKNIPTICIDGKITFVSRIPNKNELIKAIQRRINEKMRLIINRKQATLLILGGDEKHIGAVRQSVDRAVSELGAEVTISLVSDAKEIASYGVTKTPAIVAARYQIKSEGTVPTVDIVKEWIKDLL